MGIYDAVFRLQRTTETHQRRMAPGSLGGRTESASPARPMAVVSPSPIQNPPASAPLIASWNNPDGLMDASRYQRWTQLYTLGARSWFSFPEGGDTTLILMQSPGIVQITFVASGNGAFDVEVHAGNDGIVSAASSASGGKIGTACSAVFAADEVDGSFGDWPNIQVKTLGGASIVYGTLSVAYWPGDPTFSAH